MTRVPGTTFSHINRALVSSPQPDQKMTRKKSTWCTEATRIYLRSTCSVNKTTWDGSNPQDSRPATLTADPAVRTNRQEQQSRSTGKLTRAHTQDSEPPPASRNQYRNTVASVKASSLQQRRLKGEALYFFYPICVLFVLGFCSPKHLHRAIQLCA